MKVRILSGLDGHNGEVVEVRPTSVVGFALRDRQPGARTEHAGVTYQLLADDEVQS